MKLRTLSAPKFVTNPINRIAIIGDSRCANAGTNETTNYVGRGSIACISPLLNIALQGKAVVINPGETFTSNGGSLTPAVYEGFSKGSVGHDAFGGFLKQVIKHQADTVIWELIYNDCTNTTTAATAIRRRRFGIEMLLDSPSSKVQRIFLLTAWNTTDKDATAIANVNADARALAAERPNQIILVDRGDYYSANAATLLKTGESPQVHWSIAGQDQFVTDLVNAMTPYLSGTARGFPLPENAFTNPSEYGVLWSNQFSAAKLTTSEAISASNVTYNIAGGGTSLAGTVSGTTSSGGSTCAGNRLSLALLTGASYYTSWGATGTGTAFSAIGNTLVVGNRYAFACGYELQGLAPETGDSWAYLDLQLGIGATAAASQTLVSVYQLQTSAHLNKRGLLYFEFTATHAHTHLRFNAKMEQADNIAHNPAGAHSGVQVFDNAVILDLSNLIDSALE